MDITPNHPVVAAYLDYSPKSSDPETRRLWEKLVRGPAYKAAHRYQPVLKAHGMLDQVFRLQDLDALVDRLDPPARQTEPRDAESIQSGR